MKKIDRKNFFGLISSGVMIGSIISFAPIKLFGNIARSASKKIEIKIHPLAVKRTSKV
jgi:hypothetical protein